MTIDVLRASSPDWNLLPPGSLLWRVYPRRGPFPSAWNRFRHHLPGPDGRGRDQARSILYAADRFETCLAEYFQTRRVIDRARDQTTVVAFEVARPVRLLDVWGAWSTRIGASGALGSGPHDAPHLHRALLDPVLRIPLVNAAQHLGYRLL